MDNYFIRKENDFIYFVELKKEFYEPKAVMYAANMFTDYYHIKIDEVDHDTVGVWFKLKLEADKEKLETLLGNFCNEALKKQVQIDLDDRFGELRSIIYHKAFDKAGGID
ncbi:His-Xaa-Ser system protein HsxD [Veillonella denticariosi JCM 15641]|uniref:His-Xaa-Ser system protein HsxD n=1 Tax=Veillonella denticariosi JCM 15641 TaxID=1298594 RepID=A0A2S7ZAX5_9FIRM|nr:hypothetical protein [Veillonella denticariosi]PQL20413.1 His-Xaa-Ser system protein HsxD [Veillonella denticariosi JCM 15641]